MKNKVTFSFWLTLMVCAALLALYWLPVLRIADTGLRRIDMLADIRPDADEAVQDSVRDILPPVQKPAFVDTCKTGVVCIEDYADSTGSRLDAFYETLSGLHSHPGPLRIAYFGDSFIEGDILTADLRALLQQRFGGHGVGYVPITSSVAGFRPTVKHTFGGWSSHAVTDSSWFDRSRQDLSNRYFIPSKGAWVALSGQSGFGGCLDSCRTSSFFFHATDSFVLSARINGGQPVFRHFAGDSALQVASVSGPIGRVRWQVEQMDSTVTCYAVTMDDEQGVTVDNFSTRGSSGQQLAAIPMPILRSYNRLRPYDLIVLQFGLNVASENIRNYTYYITPMKRVVERFKTAFPHAAILIVSIGDRESKTETGELRTMSGVESLVRFQQALAAETHVAFWNMFQAMGGKGGMLRMVNSKPPQANLDYTHINFKGGQKIAASLFEALMYGKEQYEKRKAYEQH